VQPQAAIGVYAFRQLLILRPADYARSALVADPPNTQLTVRSNPSSLPLESPDSSMAVAAALAQMLHQVHVPAVAAAHLAEGDRGPQVSDHQVSTLALSAFALDDHPT